MKYSKYTPITRKTIHFDSVCETSSYNRLLENILNSFNDLKYSDLKIKIEDKYIYVYKFVDNISHSPVPNSNSNNNNCNLSTKFSLQRKAIVRRKPFI